MAAVQRTARHDRISIQDLSCLPRNEEFCYFYTISHRRRASLPSPQRLQPSSSPSSSSSKPSRAAQQEKSRGYFPPQPRPRCPGREKNRVSGAAGDAPVTQTGRRVRPVGPCGGWHWMTVTPRWLVPSHLPPSTWQLPGPGGVGWVHFFRSTRVLISW